MAAQVNNVQPFVSSSAYYGYMPINHHQQQQQQQTPIFNAAGMDVDSESFANVQNNNNNNNNNNVMQQKQPTHEFLMSVDEGHRRWSQGRKRGFDRDEVANYMPCFKRFRNGECNFSAMKYIRENVSCAYWCVAGRFYFYTTLYTTLALVYAVIQFLEMRVAK